MPRPWVKVDRQYLFAILPDHRRQPRADQSRRASVVIGAVLPKNAQASDWLSRTSKHSSYQWSGQFQWHNEKGLQ